MRIVMVSNTYIPHVGGVAQSVHAFTRAYQAAGAKVLVVAPEFPGTPAHEPDVIRIRALQRFNGSDFSVALPVPSELRMRVADFAPQVIHSHHPFLLGDTALRLAAEHNVPLIFTHHTMYEEYTHYVPGDSAELKNLAIALAVGYSNLCDCVLAPSASTAAILRKRGVDSPIEVLPTGVDLARFEAGDGAAFRRKMGIPKEAFVLGHVGHLAPEKNLEFLTEAAAHFLSEEPSAFFLVVGHGPSAERMRKILLKAKAADRLRFAGQRSGQDLVDAYHAMNCFVFSSKSETQGMVLTEAFASGVPVVALDAPAVRDVLQTGKNGILIGREDVQEFSKALEVIRNMEATERAALTRGIEQSAHQFSLENTARRALDLYQRECAERPGLKAIENSSWHIARKRFEVELEIWSNVAASISRALNKTKLAKFPLFGRAYTALRRVRRFATGPYWIARLLGRPAVPEAGSSQHAPGLLMIQIDGLSKRQFLEALKRKQMPFLRRLLQREGYKLHTLYSGIPSTTPAVQGELFYGVTSAVPAFSFVKRETGRLVTTLSPDPVLEIENRLAAQGPALLEGGSSYSNIYTGGAAEAHFCAANLGLDRMLYVANPVLITVLVLTHIGAFVRILLLMLLELLISIGDAAQGVLRGYGLWNELKFIATRVAVCIGLREAATTGAAVDLARGLPIIHLNYVGYDEQSHRRGPSSLFAHWGLKGIDYAIFKLWKQARRAEHRDYSVWIYSDHGQEECVPFEQRTGKTLLAAVCAVFGSVQADLRAEKGIVLQRLRWLRDKKRESLEDVALCHVGQDIRLVRIAGLGPLAHIYLPDSLKATDCDAACELLVKEHGVPAMLRRVERGRVRAWTQRGTFELPIEAGEVLGHDHPFLSEAGRDLAALCEHPDAGDLIAIGYQPGARTVSFVAEHGAHCGPGADETSAFALLPGSVPLDRRGRDFLRHADIREAAFEHLGRAHNPRSWRIVGSRHSERSIRVMTYNVHACLGTDGKLSPERIARVIALADADIVCLQELDVRRQRSNHIDQAQEIARELEMHLHFFPALALEEEKYGDAVLSRLPMRLIKAAPLPCPPGSRFLEPRGAIWVEIEYGSEKLQLINTHLGLSPAERALQIDALLGPEWLGSTELGGPRIICGDFNFRPGSRLWKRLSGGYREVQQRPGKRPSPTWSSMLPLRQIDHIFVSPGLRTIAAEVPKNELTRRASDHLPLIAEIEFASNKSKPGERVR